MRRKLALLVVISLAMLFGLAGVGHQTASQSNGGMTCWAENKSYPTTCAEEDNVNVPIFGPQVSRFWVVATHPTYNIGVDNCATDFSGCSSASAKSHAIAALQTQADPCPPGTKLWDDDGITVVIACTEQNWWRPYSMNVVVGSRSVSAHYIVLSRKIQNENSWPQFLVLYEDGNLRLKPHKQVGGPDPCFGSSVIIGPAPPVPGPKPRPYVDIQEVRVNPTVLSLDITYRNGGTAHVDLTVDRSKAVAKVAVGYSTSTAIPFATFRSMYVTNGNADVDHVQTQDGDFGILSNWTSLPGLWWFFHRNFRSQHNTSAPDIRIGADTPAVFRVERTGNVFADGAYYSGNADIAERIDISEPVEPGDVVELDPDHLGQYRKTRQAYSQLVAGVISTMPGMTLANLNQADSRPLLALLGRVLVKVITENGPIRPGDLLVSSSTSGYAMRCTKTAECEGAVIGKALEPLERGMGLILMLLIR